MTQTRTLTVRLSDQTIAGCLDILSLSELEANLPASSIVRSALEGLVAYLQKVGQIPERTPEEAKVKLQEYFHSFFSAPEIDEFDLKAFLTVIPRPETLPEEEEEPLVEDSVEELLRQMHESEPAIEDAEDEVVIEEAAPIPVVRLDLFMIERIRFDELKKRAPKDALLCSIQEDAKDTALVAALEVAYTQLPIERWSTPECNRLIASLMAQHRTSEDNTPRKEGS